jgi:hypothetical protein
VIYADALTEAALLSGIRAGHVYVKTRGPEGPDVRFTAPDLKASMGDTVTLDTPVKRVGFRVVVMNGAGQQVDLIRNGKAVENAVPTPVGGSEATFNLSLEVSRGDNVRVTVRDNTGVTVFTNPIYFR